MIRDWIRAREKVGAEGNRCRKCRSRRVVQAAHIVGREHDRTPSLDRRELDKNFMVEPYEVHPDRIIPLCERCHRAYDDHQLDLLPYLSLAEELQAVYDAGGIEQARIRICPTAYPSKVMSR